MKEMVQLAHDLKIQLEANNLEVVGELLDKNWKIKCQMAQGLRIRRLMNGTNKG